jgi:GTP-binding protein
MAEEYLLNRQALVLSIQLVDARHSPTALDIQLNDWLVHHDKPHVVVATKADKLSGNKLAKHVSEIRRMLTNSTVIAFSSVTGKGRDEVLGLLQKHLKKSDN